MLAHYWIIFQENEIALQKKRDLSFGKLGRVLLVGPAEYISAQLNLLRSQVGVTCFYTRRVPSVYRERETGEGKPAVESERHLPFRFLAGNLLAGRRSSKRRKKKSVGKGERRRARTTANLIQQPETYATQDKGSWRTLK